MKNIYICFIFIFLPFFCLTQQIEFNENSLNFGDVKEGETLTAYFFFKNTGDSTLIIKNVKSSSSCISVLFPKKTILLKGECGVIEGKINTNGKSGNFKKTILVTSNSKINETIVLFVNANIIKKDSNVCLSNFFIEHTNISLEDIGYDKEKTVLIKIKNTGNSSLNFDYEHHYVYDPMKWMISDYDKYITVCNAPFEWFDCFPEKKSFKTSLHLKPEDSASLCIRIHNIFGNLGDFNLGLKFTGNFPDSSILININGVFTDSVSNRTRFIYDEKDCLLSKIDYSLGLLRSATHYNKDCSIKELTNYGDDIVTRYYIYNTDSSHYKYNAKTLKIISSEHFENGILVSKSVYLKDHRIDVNYYLNGNIRNSISCSGANLDGKTTEYYENGIVKEMITRKMNYADGKYNKWHPNGKLAIKGKYDSSLKKLNVNNTNSGSLIFYDFKSGIWKYWDETGRKIKKEIYKNGVLIKDKIFQ